MFGRGAPQWSKLLPSGLAGRSKATASKEAETQDIKPESELPTLSEEWLLLVNRHHHVMGGAREVLGLQTEGVGLKHLLSSIDFDRVSMAVTDAFRGQSSSLPDVRVFAKRASLKDLTVVSCVSSDPAQPFCLLIFRQAASGFARNSGGLDKAPSKERASKAEDNRDLTPILPGAVPVQSGELEVDWSLSEVGARSQGAKSKEESLGAGRPASPRAFSSGSLAYSSDSLGDDPLVERKGSSSPCCRTRPKKKVGEYTSSMVQTTPMPGAGQDVGITTDIVWSTHGFECRACKKPPKAPSSPTQQDFARNGALVSSKAKTSRNPLEDVWTILSDDAGRAETWQLRWIMSRGACIDNEGRKHKLLPGSKPGEAILNGGLVRGEGLNVLRWTGSNGVEIRLIRGHGGHALGEPVEKAAFAGKENHSTEETVKISSNGASQEESEEEEGLFAADASDDACMASERSEGEERRSERPAPSMSFLRKLRSNLGL